MEKEERILLFWSPRVERIIPNELWEGADRIVDVPDSLTSETIDVLAKNLMVLLKEEVIKAKSENKNLRIIQLAPSAFRSTLDHVLNTTLNETKAGLEIIQKKKLHDEAPVVMLDDAEADRLLRRLSGFIDFNKPPLEDKRLFNDDLPATPEKPTSL